MRFIFLAFFLFIAQFTYAQYNDYPNTPTLYGEVFGGFVLESFDEAAPAFGLEANYHKGRFLYSVRYTFIPKLTSRLKDVIAFVGIPEVVQESKTSEFAGLFGPRWIAKNSSYSVSGGVAVSNRLNVLDPSGREVREKETYLGFPFELNIKWFRNRTDPRNPSDDDFHNKKPFGAGIGFKIIGNISKHSYVGAAVVFSLGVHSIH
tara:strand:- start:2703 stop:3317 length:615 start_codon:yes stop_codon:yes gene_type:complete